MSFKLIGGGSNLDTVVSDMNQNILELKGNERAQIFKDDAGVRRVLLGKGANGFYGLKVSKEGFDVTEVTDADLVFSSDRSTLKIALAGGANVTKQTLAIGGANYDSGSATTTIAHGLGYIPIVLATTQSGGYILPYTYRSESGAGFMQHTIEASVDGTNLYITDSAFGYNHADNAQDLDVYYYLLVPENG